MKKIKIIYNNKSKAERDYEKKENVFIILALLCLFCIQVGVMFKWKRLKERKR